MTATPHLQYVRHRLYPRLRHARKMQGFLAGVSSALTSTATGVTAAPLRTINTFAEAVIVFGGNLSAADTLTLGLVTYTAKATLTEVAAFGTLTNDGTNVSNGDTVTIDGKVYTFQTSLTEVNGNVKIGASNTASMTNLFHAINASGGTAGTDYATATTAHATVTATNPTGTTVKVTAKTPGVAGNLLATTEASTHLAWGGAVLASGVDPVANEILVDDTAAHTRDNFVSAINGTSGAGTKYSTGTVQHPVVQGSALSGNLLVQTRVAGTNGSTVHLAKLATNLTLPTVHTLDGPLWTVTGHGFDEGEGPYKLTSATTLPAGTPTGDLWVHVFDVNHVAFATSLAALSKGDFIQTTDAGTGTHTVTHGVNAAAIFELMKAVKPRTIAAATDIDTIQ